jgi:hypothetical protein
MSLRRPKLSTTKGSSAPRRRIDHCLYESSAEIQFFGDIYERDRQMTAINGRLHCPSFSWHQNFVLTTIRKNSKKVFCPVFSDRLTTLCSFSMPKD